MFKKRKNVEKSIVFRQIRYKRRSKIKFISVIRKFHFSLFRTCSTMLIFGRLSAFPFFFLSLFFSFSFCNAWFCRKMKFQKILTNFKAFAKNLFFFFCNPYFVSLTAYAHAYRIYFTRVSRMNKINLLISLKFTFSEFSIVNHFCELRVPY